MKLLSKICTAVLGIVFIISGIVKLMDPVGTGFIMEEYFKFLHVRFMTPLAVPAGIVASAVEFLLGGFLLIRFKMKFAAIASAVMMAFYTVLTLFLMIFDPPMECGCFGEVIHLTNTQTFIKNVVLDLLLVLPLLNASSLEKSIRKWRTGYKLAMLAASVVSTPALSLMHRPFIDFTDYKPSTVLSEGSSSENHFSEAMSFVYEKDGERRTFGLDALPDSTWTYVETVTEEVVSSAGETRTLSLRDFSGDYVSDLDAFSDEKSFVVSVYEPEAFNENDWNRVKAFCDSVDVLGINAMVAVGAPVSDIEKYSEILGRPVYVSDYKTLITFNRSNGGFTYVYNYVSSPTVIEKWSFRMMKSISPKEISLKDPDLLLMRATVQREAFFQLLLLIYVILLAF